MLQILCSSVRVKEKPRKMGGWIKRQLGCFLGDFCVVVDVKKKKKMDRGWILANLSFSKIFLT